MIYSLKHSAFVWLWTYIEALPILPREFWDVSTYPQRVLFGNNNWLLQETYSIDFQEYNATLCPDNYHTQWVMGRTLQIGLTTTFPLNTKVLYTYNGQTYDVDYTSARVSPTAPTQSYRTVTARSYHSGGVNGLMMDGSVHFTRSSIAQATWRAMGTRSGGEVVSGD